VREDIVMVFETMTSARGAAVLVDPLRNKGTAFTSDERRALQIEGLLPPAVSTIEQQLERGTDALLLEQIELEVP
jgi:hypothetical protein